MKINSKLKKYIEENILPEYSKNDNGHKIDHAIYVIKRSLMFASTLTNINYDMVYTIAAYHDVGVHIDRENHEKVSGQILLTDENLKEFFSAEEMQTMAEAVENHRASMKHEPRNIYGKIVSSADRNVNIEFPLQRTLSYRMRLKIGTPMEEILEESRKHLIEKFGKKGYATEKMYFDDEEYCLFLENINALTHDKEAFKRKYIEVNHLEGIFYNPDIDDRLKRVFELIKQHNPDLSLDSLLCAVYKESGLTDSFENVRKRILASVGIDEFPYYLKDVNPALKEYVEKNIFPKYEDNDQAHGIIHIKEVIRRALALNETLHLNLDKNKIYAIAAYHDLGKFIDQNTHEKIAANLFIQDESMKIFFTDEERKIIKEAIEDHRSSASSEPRTIYGRLISSADRNTRIEIVFIRSFFVAKERQPQSSIEDYLDYTYKRLSKRYSKENPENMFFQDEIYQVFLHDMRELLKNEQEFKDLYCKINHIKDRNKTVDFYEGEPSYIKSYKKGKQQI